MRNLLFLSGQESNDEEKRFIIIMYPLVRAQSEFLTILFMIGYFRPSNFHIHISHSQLVDRFRMIPCHLQEFELHIAMQVETIKSKKKFLSK